MKSKWKIKGIPGFVFGEDKKLYRLPYTNGNRSYNLREIKKQYGSRYRINNEWYSVKQLRLLVELDEEPVLLRLEEDPF